MKTGILKRYCYMMYFYLKKKEPIFSKKTIIQSLQPSSKIFVCCCSKNFSQVEFDFQYLHKATSFWVSKHGFSWCCWVPKSRSVSSDFSHLVTALIAVLGKAGLRRIRNQRLLCK